MKVTISVGGRFHAFYLANQLQKRGHLQKLITSYPKFETVKYGIPKKKINSIIIKEILQRGWSKLPDSVNKIYNPTSFINETFDKLASRKITKTDLFVGWSTKSLYTMRKAKDLGATTVLERGSSHRRYQEQILKEEYDKLGISHTVGLEKVAKKELKEYEEADYIEVPSTFVKRTFIDKGFPEEKIILGFRGVDLSEFKQIDKNDDVFRVVFAGGMNLRKGVPYLLRAFSELNLPNSELILLGSKDNDIKSFFQKYNVKSGDKPSVGNREILHLGHKPQNELYKYYSQGSVFVMPSIEEGLAGVQPQAMACGLPLICTTNTGGEDLIRDGKDGFVIPIRDVDSLKEKLTFMYENPKKCKEMGQSAKDRITSRFTWDDYGEKITKKYKSILNKD